MPGEVLHGLVIALCGNFGPDWTHGKLARFIHNNGGRHAHHKEGGITHLVATVESYEKNEEAIRRAKRLGIYIVTFDWLEDTLQQHKKKRESSYLLAKAVKLRHKQKTHRRELRKRVVNERINDFAQRVAKARQTYLVSGYHEYLDPTGFRYDITLVRTNILDSRKEYVVLKLHQTDRPPHYFACMSEYVSPDGHMSRTIQASVQSSFEAAFEAFQRVFKEKTFKEWNDRLDDKPVLLGNGEPNPRAYEYRPPTDGPRGMFGGLVYDEDGGVSGVARERMMMPPEPQLVINRRDNDMEADVPAAAESLTADDSGNEATSAIGKDGGIRDDIDNNKIWYENRPQGGRDQIKKVCQADSGKEKKVDDEEKEQPSGFEGESGNSGGCGREEESGNNQHEQQGTYSGYGMVQGPWGGITSAAVAAEKAADADFYRTMRAAQTTQAMLHVKQRQPIVQTRLDMEPKAVDSNEQEGDCMNSGAV